jgi:hypothetical protein
MSFGTIGGRKLADVAEARQAKEGRQVMSSVSHSVLAHKRVEKGARE